MPKNSIPKRKKFNRTKRLLSAKNWINDYEGNKIVKAYSKWYRIDLICAIKELRILNIQICAHYEKGIRASLESESKKKSEHRKSSNTLNFETVYGIDFDENFATIIGNTNGGVPYGITHEELEKLKEEANQL